MLYEDSSTALFMVFFGLKPHDQLLASDLQFDVVYCFAFWYLQLIFIPKNI